MKPTASGRPPNPYTKYRFYYGMDNVVLQIDRIAL